MSEAPRLGLGEIEDLAFRALVAAMHEQPDVRIPGDGRRAARRRVESEGVVVNSATLEKVISLVRS